MIVPQTRSRRSSLLTAAASLAVVTSTAPAAIKTWDGQGDSNWQTATNWDADAAPLPGDSLVFQGTAGLANMNNFAADTRFAGISFAAASGAFVLSGNSIVLAGNVSNASDLTQSIAIPLKLGDGTFVFTGSATTGASLALASITAPASAGGAAVFNPATGGITTTAANVNGILGAWATTGNTTNGTNWATVDGGSITAYAGYTVVALNADIPNDPVANVRLSGDANVAGGVTEINTLKTSATAGTGGNDITITAGGTLRFGTAGGILQDTGVANNMRIGSNTNGLGNNTITAGGAVADTPGTLVLSAASTASNNGNVIGLLGTVTDNGNGAVTLVKTGLAFSYLDANNSYTGGSFVNEGQLQGNRGTSFGTGPVLVKSGARAFFNATATFTNDITLSGTGPTVDNAGALRLSNATLAGTVALRGNTRTQVNGNTTAFINGKITGTGSFELNGTGGTNTPVLVLGNTANDWSGNLVVNGNAATVNATVRLGASEVVPHGPGAGNLVVSASNGTGNSRVDLNGFSETINGLNSAIAARLQIINSSTTTPATLTFGANDANGDFGGAILKDTAANAISLVKTGGGTQILRGGNFTYLGTTTVNAGRLEFVGDVNAEGAIAVNNGGALASNGSILAQVSLGNGGHLVPTGATTLSALSPAEGSNIDFDTALLTGIPVTVTGSISPAGPAGGVSLNFSGLAPLPGSYPLISYTGGSLAGSGFPAFKIGTVPGRLAATLVHDAGLQLISLNVSSAGDAIKWSGGLDSQWTTDILGAPKNWTLASNPANKTDFVAGDMVIFDDTAGNNTVAIDNTDVTPGMVTFSNSDDDYLITGSKGITGTGGILLDGSGTVILATNNSYTGITVINSGTLKLGNGGSSGTIGGGEVMNEGALVLDRSDVTTVPNGIFGNGGIRHEGSGTTTLSGASIYGGDVIIAAGTLRATNNGSLGGAGWGEVQVQAGGSLDLGGSATANTMNFGTKLFSIAGNGPAGNGAIVNVGTINQQDALQVVELTADSSVGGSARFDVRGASSDLDLNGHILRKRGTGQFSLVDTLIHGGGGIVVEQGTLGIEATARTDGSGSIIYEAGSQALFYQNNPAMGGITWPITVREGVNIGNAGPQAATIPAPVILEGNVQLVGYNAGLPAPTFNRPLIFTGNLTENGGSYTVTKNGMSEVTYAGTASSYTGPTNVNAGSLIVNGTLTHSAVTVAAAATFGGNGTSAGTLAAGGVISPGITTIGTFNTGTATFSATGSLAAQINSDTLASDKLVVTGILNLGGSMLHVTDLGAVTLPVDTKFTIASYSGGLTGAFANAPDGAFLSVGPNSFKIDYDEVVSGQSSITLTVAAGSAYDQWASFHGLDGTNNGKSADPDRDGLENIVEFGLDLDPLDSGNGGKIRALVSDLDPGAAVNNAFTLTLPMRTDADFTGSTSGDLLSLPVDGVIYRVEGSTTLSGFPLDITEVTPALSSGMTTPSSGWAYRSFRLPGTPGSPNPKAFLRVDVAEAP